MSRTAFRRLAPALLLALVAACERDSTGFSAMAPTLDQQLRAQFDQWGVVRIGAAPVQDSNLVRLGQALMFDKVMSGNRDVACASCHQPAQHMTDGRSLAIGTKGRLARRSAPTLVGIGLGLYELFWDARLTGQDLLQRQAQFPVLDRIEMRGDSADGGGNELALIADDDTLTIDNAIMARLLAYPGYQQLFAAAFPASQHDYSQVARAIAAFEIAALTKAESPLDRYLDHDDAALSLEEKRGALLFFGKARCSQCHSGPLLGGNGNIANTDAPQIGAGLDSGVAAVAAPFGGPPNSFYRFAFRVPQLRNVELTAPYFHDGAYPTLEAVVRHYNDVRAAVRAYDPANVAPAMRPLIHTDDQTLALVESTLDGRLDTPLGLTDAEQSDLVAFLKSLTDPAARDLTALRPASVPSGLPVP